MSFETFPPQGSEGNDTHDLEQLPGFDERLGGPLKPNHFLTTRLAVDRVKPILEHLKVHNKISLYTPEISLGMTPSGESFAPAEYRIEIMDPNAPEKPAAPSYVQFVFDALRKAELPISKAALDSLDCEDK
jgi:hypothetical protein